MIMFPLKNLAQGGVTLAWTKWPAYLQIWFSYVIFLEEILFPSQQAVNIAMNKINI